MKFLKLTLNAILIIFIAFALPFVAFTLLTAKTPVLSGIRSFVVMTGSMEPTIMTGSIVYSKRQAAYAKGDIIAFERNDITITHRIILVTKKNNTLQYQTKGDANKSADITPVVSDAVLGKETVAIPYVGTFILFLRTVPGFVGIVLIPTILLIGFEIMNIKREMEKEIERKILKKVANSEQAKA